MNRRTYFGAMMCRLGKADGLISGLTQYYPDTIRPCLEVIGTRKGVKRVCVVVQRLDVIRIGCTDGYVIRRAVAFGIDDSGANSDGLAFGGFAVLPEAFPIGGSRSEEHTS